MDNQHLNYFHPTDTWRMVWNSFNCGRVGFWDWWTILKWFILFKINKGYYIPRILDTDSDFRKRSKKTIIKYMIPFIFTNQFDKEGNELLPMVMKLKKDKIFFSFLKAGIGVDNRDKLEKILQIQLLDANGIKLGNGIIVDFENCLIRFAVNDTYGSSELLFDGIGILADVVDTNNKKRKTSDIIDSILKENKDTNSIPKNRMSSLIVEAIEENQKSNMITFESEDIDVINKFEDNGLLLSSAFKANFSAGLHIITNSDIPKEDILVSRLSIFAKELSKILPYRKAKSAIDWNMLTKKSYYNIVD